MSKRYFMVPKKARSTHGSESWWYANRGSIQVFIRANGKAACAIIKRSDLLKYIEQTKG